MLDFADERLQYNLAFEWAINNAPSRLFAEIQKLELYKLLHTKL